MPTTKPKPYPKCKAKSKKPKRARVTLPLSEKGRARIKGPVSKIFSFQTREQAATFWVEVRQGLGLDAVRSTTPTEDGLWLVAVKGLS